jgi:mannose-6-phosphate isomerase-like protein (cupin superfamily)
MAVDAPRVIGSGEGEVEFLGSIGARFLIDGEEAGQRFALVEHPMPPRALASPIHRHHREDEYSFVLEGDVGVLLGEAVVTGRTGDLIVKPRGQWHTFWNAGDAPARVLEIISPAGFETSSARSPPNSRPARRIRSASPRSRANMRSTWT